MEGIMDWEDVLWLCVVLGGFYWWAIRTIFKNRTKFMSTDLASEPKRTPHMNRDYNLTPEDEVIDVYWVDVTEDFERAEEGMKPYNKLNLMILALVIIYYLSDWLAYIITWLIFTVSKHVPF
jgi:hypothetical protein